MTDDTIGVSQLLGHMPRLLPKVYANAYSGTFLTLYYYLRLLENTRCQLDYGFLL